jgi:hypothetical protein
MLSEETKSDNNDNDVVAAEVDVTAFVIKNKKKSFKVNFTHNQLDRCVFLSRALASSKSSMPLEHTLAPIIVKLYNDSNASISNLILYILGKKITIESYVDFTELVVLAISLEIEPLAKILLYWKLPIEPKRAKKYNTAMPRRKYIRKNIVQKNKTPPPTPANSMNDNDNDDDHYNHDK